MNRRYAIIAPCRDEASHMEATLASLAAQTAQPALVLVVDDGSTDATPRILEAWKARLPSLRVLRRADRGKRAVGPGVVDAFYEGYASINPDDFDYVCKLDMDLEIPARYFETLLDRMEAEPRLGTCSGKPFVRRADGSVEAEHCGSENSVGMSKFYRVACFRQIGGFVREVMWDGIDCHRCRMLGWIAASWDDSPDLRFIHLRPMGSSQVSIRTGRMRHGFGQWFMGTGLVYMTASAVFRMASPPVILGGALMWWGYVRSMLRGVPRYSDLRFRAFLRRYQWRCLTRGKDRATRELNALQAGAWNPAAPPATPIALNAPSAAPGASPARVSA